MTDQTTVRIEGLDEAIREYKQLPAVLSKHLTRAMQKALGRLQRAVAKYPPSTAANRPGRTRNGLPMGYYERGRGWWSPLLKNGEAVGYQNDGQSEMLGRSWTSRILPQSRDLAGELGTGVSYADEVQGTRQKDVHKRTGWMTLAKAVERETMAINRDFETAVGRAIDEVNA